MTFQPSASRIEEAILTAFDRTRVEVSEDTRTRALQYAEEQVFGPEGVSVCTAQLFALLESFFYCPDLFALSF